MMLPEQGCLLRIFVGEGDRFEGKSLYEWIVWQARQEGWAGATVLRGMMGFGPGSRVYTSKILRLSKDLPVVIEIVDTYEKLEGFVAVIDRAIVKGLVTLERCRVRLYRGGE